MDKKIITLTSDFGRKEFYSAIVKGKILSVMPDIAIVDANHNVERFNIIDASFIVKNFYRFYPSGTIHLIFVESDSANAKPSLMRMEDQYFICADNGILALIAGNTPHELFYITNTLEFESTFETTISAFITVSEQIYKEDFETLDKYITPIKRLNKNYNYSTPAHNSNEMHGIIYFIDNYENAISNISKKEFYDFVGNDRYKIFVNSNTNVIYEVSEDYADVETVTSNKESSLFAVFGIHGYLEIGMYHSTAGSLLGLKPGSTIIIKKQ